MIAYVNTVKHRIHYHLNSLMMMIMMMMNFFGGGVWLTGEGRLALIRSDTIVRDPRHRESLTRRQLGLNLRTT